MSASIPKLLIQGHLIKTDGSPPQSELDKHVPINYIIDWITQRRNMHGIKNRVLVLESDTGTGKSSILPPELYHVFKSDTRNIISAQPRVFNTKQIPKDILPFHTSETLKGTGREPLVMGKNIGYQTGEFVKRPNNGLIFMTYGTLLGQLNSYTDEEIINRYQFIIIDEAHEKDISSTTLHYVLREFLKKCGDDIRCPIIIITSATLTPSEFMKYYGTDSHIRVSGLTYEVVDNYLPYDSTNYISSIVETVKSIHIDYKSDFDVGQIRDVIIFVGGGDEIMNINGKLRRLNESDDFFKKYPILPLELSRRVIVGGLRDQKHIYADITKPIDGVQYYRRVITSTNVGETGITYPYIKYVIDSGFYKVMEYYPDFDYFILAKRPVSHDIRMQRRGRTGRIIAGEVYYMYSEETAEKLNNNKPADMVIEDITLTLLKLIVYLYDRDALLKPPVDAAKLLTPKSIDLLNLGLIDQPAATSIQMCISKLYNLGFLDERLCPTLYAFCAAKINRIDVEQLRIIYAAYNWGTSVEDCIVMALLLPHKLRKIYPKRLSDKYDAFKSGFGKRMIGKNQDFYYAKVTSIMSCDFMKFLLHYHVATDLIKAGKTLAVAAETVGIAPDILGDILKYRDHAFIYLAEIGLNPMHGADKKIIDIVNNSESDINDLIDGVRLLKHCLYEGLKLRTAEWNGRMYITRQTRLAINTSVRDYKRILYDNVEIKIRGFGRIKSVDKVSILDGYIPF